MRKIFWITFIIGLSLVFLKHFLRIKKDENKSLDIFAILLGVIFGFFGDK